jgi:hypothetical protein
MKARHIYLILFGSYALAMQAFKALGMVKVYNVATILAILFAWAVVAGVFLLDVADMGTERKRAQLAERIMRRAAEK